MIKKNLWIVALLTALALTAFFVGCIEPLAESKDEGTYREVEIKGFNAWGGNKENQQGWGTDGAKWDSGKKTVESIGLSIEDLQAAKYLVVEVNDGFPKNNFETIWDGWDADGNKTGDWAQFSQITSAGGELNPGFGTRDGNILKLEMAKIIKDYSAFRNKSTVAITLLIQHWGNGGTGACIKSAKLLVSDEPVPFVPIRNMSLVTNTFFWTNELALDVKSNPGDATNQRVTWAIMRWRSASGGETIDLSQANAGNYQTVKAALLAKVNWKQEEYIIDDSVYPNEMGEKSVIGTLIAPGGTDSVGTVTLYAIVKEGTLEDTTKPESETNAIIDFEKDFTVTIRNPPPLVYKVGGVEYPTVQYGAVDNGGVSGGSIELTDEVDGKRTGYTITYGGGYGNSAHYIEITFPPTKKLDDYSGLTCNYTSTNCDLTGKSVRVKAMTSKPTRTYNPGPYIATISFSRADFEDAPEGVSGKSTPLSFEFYEDNASNADGTTNQGIYNAGVGKDLSSSSEMAASANAEGKANPGRFIVDGVNVKNANKIYIWFLPWGDGGTVFTISDINFVPK